MVVEVVVLVGKRRRLRSGDCGLVSFVVMVVVVVATYLVQKLCSQSYCII